MAILEQPSQAAALALSLMFWVTVNAVNESIEV